MRLWSLSIAPWKNSKVRCRMWQLAHSRQSGCQTLSVPWICGSHRDLLWSPWISLTVKHYLYPSWCTHTCSGWCWGLQVNWSPDVSAIWGGWEAFETWDLVSQLRPLGQESKGYLRTLWILAATMMGLAASHSCYPLRTEPATSGFQTW